MKKVFFAICFVAQLLIICVAELGVIAVVSNCFADAIGYHGFWNIPVFFIVSVLVCTTFAVFIKEIRN